MPGPAQFLNVNPLSISTRIHTHTHIHTCTHACTQKFFCMLVRWWSLLDACGDVYSVFTLMRSCGLASGVHTCFWETCGPFSWFEHSPRHSHQLPLTEGPCFWLQWYLKFSIDAAFKPYKKPGSLREGKVRFFPFPTAKAVSFLLL
jgi:hypothetical protein